MKTISPTKPKSSPFEQFKNKNRQFKELFGAGANKTWPNWLEQAQIKPDQTGTVSTVHSKHNNIYFHNGLEPGLQYMTIQNKLVVTVLQVKDFKAHSLAQ